MKQLCILVTLATMTGCASFEAPEPTQTNMENSHILTTTSGQGQIYVMARNTDHYLCSLPQPDSAFDQKDEGDFDISLVSNKTDRNASADEASEEVELAGRTPGVLITRELFFRACEFSSNYQLDKQEAKALYLKTLDGVLANWAIEAARTNVNIGDTVNNQTKISTAKEQTTAVTPTTTSTSTDAASSGY